MSQERTRPQAPDVTPSREAPELPTEKAFVVQLTRETGPDLQPFAGRVEHVVSGRRLRFEGFEAFRAAVTRLRTDATRSGKETRASRDRCADRSQVPPQESAPEARCEFSAPSRE